MHPGLALIKLIKDAGGTKKKVDGHHETWILKGYAFRISTAGRRPTHVFNRMTLKVKALIRKAERE